MREIIFRGKRVDNGEWVCGHYFRTPLRETDEKTRAIYFFKNDGTVKDCIADTGGNVYNIIVETLGEYTNLKDKNGNMIFEGDNVAFRGDFAIPEKCGEFVATIKYSTEHCGFVLQSQKHIWLINDETDEFDCKSLVVGNIHEVNNA